MYLDIKKILFFYKMDDFFNLASFESMYRSQLDIDKNGLSRLDYVSLTEFDRGMYNLLLKRAAKEAFINVQSWAHGNTEGFVFDGLPRRTITQLNSYSEPIEDLYFKLLDAGILTLGNLTVAKDDIVHFKDGVWLSADTIDFSYIFYTLNLPDNFDPNNLFGLDILIKEFITIFLVREWFRRKHYDLELVEIDYGRTRLELANMLDYRITFNRKYRTF